MLYDAYEVQRSLLAGASKLAGLGAGWLNNPANPWGYSSMGPMVAASLEVFAHADRAARQARIRNRQRRTSAARTCAVHEEILLRKPFGQLKHFYREGVESGPRLLIVAPMSGHYATLLRGTVERLLPSYRRLHHRLARREAGAAVGRQLRSRRLYRLSDRVPRADRRPRPASGRTCSRSASRRCRPSPRRR